MQIINSDRNLQDIDETNNKILDRKRRDTTANDEKTATELLEPSVEKILEPIDRADVGTSEQIDRADVISSDSGERNGSLIKRSNDGFEGVVTNLDEIAELLEGSENNEDIQRRTRQLRPSAIISSPWRISSGATYRALDYSPPRHNSFPSSSNSNYDPFQRNNNFYKGDNRFFQAPSNTYKSSNEFSPVITSYSNKNRFNLDYKHGFGGFSGSAEDTTESSRETTTKFKQSSKIPAHSNFLPVLQYAYNPFDGRTKIHSTASPDPTIPDNFAYYHLKNQPSPTPQSHSSHNSHSSQNQNSQSQGSPQSSKVKTYAFPVSGPTTRSPYISYNSVGGFFNNQPSPAPDSEKYGFLPIKPSKHNPAPIYEGGSTASSYHERFTSTTPKNVQLQSTPYSNNPFLNNLKFKAPTIYAFSLEDSKDNKYNHEQKVVEITTKANKHHYNPLPIPSAPKYEGSYTTPAPVFDFDKFLASIRDAHRAQVDMKLMAGINNIGESVIKNRTTSLIKQNNPVQYYSPSIASSTVKSPFQNSFFTDEDPFSKFKPQSGKTSVTNYNNYNSNKKPSILNSNTASDEEDEYYYDDEDDDDYVYRPPPAIKPKYAPMTETMAPRPMNMTTPRPNYYVSGHTYTTQIPMTTSSIPSIIKFPDDVFQAFRPITTKAPAIVHIGGKTTQRPATSKPKPISLFKEDVIYTTAKPVTSSRPTIKKLKIYKSTSTTIAPSLSTTKPIRTTTRRKVYTVRPSRGSMKFTKDKASSKRPDLTKHRLELDEKLANR